MKKDFWANSTVVVLGAGSFGSVLADIASKNCQRLRIWMREEERVREINSTRSNPRYAPGLQFNEKVVAMSELHRIFEDEVHAILWVLPSSVCREVAREIAPHIKGQELLLHATKGVESGSLKRVSTILLEELPLRRIGVISGPNLAAEIAQQKPAATVVASRFPEVIEAGGALLSGPHFKVYPETDVVGVEWAGTLKNILAIASGALDALHLGWNARSMLITRGLAEMVRFGLAMGASHTSFLGLAGIGDLLATCASSLSRNYRVGYELASGRKLSEILQELGSTAEGVQTAQVVSEFAKSRNIAMPITEAVSGMIKGERTAQKAFADLMALDPMGDVFGSLP